MVISKLKYFTLYLTVLIPIVFLITFLPSNETVPVLWAAELNVRATVPPRLHLNILFQLPEITISQPDVQRGYLELPSVSLFEVESNNPNGYLLAFEGSLGPFKEVHIQGLNNPAQLENGNAFILQPYTRLKKETIELSYRGILSKNTTPGLYPWPFTISVQPVEYLDNKRKKR